MAQNKLWMVAVVFGGFVETVHVFDNRKDADSDFDAIGEENFDPDEDDVKMFEVSLKTLKETVVRSWFNEHPED